MDNEGAIESAKILLDKVLVLIHGEKEGEGMVHEIGHTHRINNEDVSYRPGLTEEYEG